MVWGRYWIVTFIYMNILLDLSPLLTDAGYFARVRELTGSACPTEAVWRQVEGELREGTGGYRHATYSAFRQAWYRHLRQRHAPASNRVVLFLLN